MMRGDVTLTTREVCSLTGENERQIQRLIGKGKISTERIEGNVGQGGISYRIPLTALPAEAQIKYLRATVMRDMEGSRYEFDLAGYKVRKGDAGLKILLERQEAVIAFHVLQRDGKGKLKERIDALAAQYGVSGMTLRRWARASPSGRG